MIQREKLSLTTSGGSASENTRKFHGQCGLIVIVPTTSTTSYNAKLTDSESVDVWERKGIVGTLRDLSQFLVKGVYTLALSNASADEAFTVEISVDERP